MQRKMLEDMGLTKEQIDQIMGENGKDIEAQKSVTTQYKNQLDEVQTKLDGFKDVNVADLQGKIATLTNDLATTKQTYEAQIDSMKFQTALESKLSGAKAKNVKAVMALLDVEALKKSKNQDTDITEAIEALKKENGYLFGEETTTPRVVTGTHTDVVATADKKAAANEAFRSLLRSQE